MFVQLLVMTSLSEYMWLCRSQWVRQLHVLLFSRNKKTQGRCHRCLFKHPASSNSSIVSLSLCYTTGLNATQAIEALSPIMLPVLWPTDTTKYWQQRSGAVVVCAFVLIQSIFVFRHPPFKELLAAGIHSSSFYLSELPSSLSSPPPFSHYVKLLWHCSTWASGVKIFLLNDKWTCG